MRVEMLLWRLLELACGGRPDGMPLRLVRFAFAGRAGGLFGSPNHFKAQR